MKHLDFLDPGVLTCKWVPATPHPKELSTFMSTKQFHWVSTERLLISSSWQWYLLQRIVYCSHITLFTYLGIGGPWLQPHQHPP